MQNKTRDEKGRFLPGQKSTGRQRGTGNKVSNEVREKFQQLVDSYSLQQMKIDLMELKPEERLRIMSGLLDFFMPKLNRTDHSMTMGDETIIVTPLCPPSWGENATLEPLDRKDDNRLIQSEDIQPDLSATTE